MGVLLVVDPDFQQHKSACGRSIQPQYSGIRRLLRSRKLEWFIGNFSWLQTRTKDVVSIRMFFLAGKLEVFVEIFENDRRSRDCLNIAHRRYGSIGAIDDFETGSPAAVERMYVVPLERLC